MYCQLAVSHATSALPAPASSAAATAAASGRTDTAGHLFMSIRMGGRVVEFEKGKSAVAVPSKEKLPTVITTLIEAVRAGELDEVLAQAKRPAFGKAKKAA